MLRHSGAAGPHSKYFAAILLASVTLASLSRYASRNMRNMSIA